VQCSGDGAIFCDGEFVDAGGNLQECIDALNAILDVEVSGSASCSGNTCQAEGSVSLSCAVDEQGYGDQGWLVGLLLAGVVAGAARRRHALPVV
jgi:hypothetical protein